MNLQRSATTHGVPWLEFFPQQGGPVQKSAIDSFPFSIGRNDTTDLPINSTRVSREHAAIVKAGNAYRVRDLDSTNGTFVNGQRIEEATLNDGDILVIADVEFTFFSGNTQAVRKTITQVIEFRESDANNPKTHDLIRSVRRLQETLLQGGERIAYRAIVDLQSAAVSGYEASATSAHVPRQQTEGDRQVLNSHTRLATRLRESFCLAATERVASLPSGSKLFLPLETAEIDIEVIDRLFSRLRVVLPDLGRLVLDLPDSAVNDIPYFHELHARVRESGAQLCYSDFAAGKPQVDVHRLVPPDYLKLSRSMIRGLSRDPNRQTQIETLIQSCREVGSEVIAIEIDTDHDAAMFRELGCRFASGALYGDLAGNGLPAAKSAGSTPQNAIANAAAVPRLPVPLRSGAVLVGAQI